MCISATMTMKSFHNGRLIQRPLLGKVVLNLTINTTPLPLWASPIPASPNKHSPARAFPASTKPRSRPRSPALAPSSLALPRRKSLLPRRFSAKLKTVALASTKPRRPVPLPALALRPLLLPGLRWAGMRSVKLPVALSPVGTNPHAFPSALVQKPRPVRPGGVSVL